MRVITADYIFPVSSPPIKNGTIVVDDDGTIIDVFSQSQNSNSESETYKGIICPGFINSHCHLELSYMKGMISEHTGLDGFIKEFLMKRNNGDEKLINDNIATAELEMIHNGIVAVGDISNNDSTFFQKQQSNLYYHTFIELFDLIPEKANETFDLGVRISGKYQALAGNHWSLVPHAPYSVSNVLMEMISKKATEKNSVLTIHNQETESENDLFNNKTGKLFALFKSINIDLNNLPVTGKSSSQSYLHLLPKENKILLVHNTFTGKEDIQFAHQYSKNIYWCFCPNANLYIENKLPDFEIFIEENAKCCVGSDSYASNWSLSVLDELKTISKYTSKIPLQTLLKWGTLNGAEFFGIENQFGSIEKNKKPGLNLIENVDLENMCLTTKSKIKKLI